MKTTFKNANNYKIHAIYKHYTPNREHLSGFKGTFVTQRAEKEENPKSLTLRGLSTSRGLSHRA